MPLVQTNYGAIKGILCENDEAKYLAFKGIPYAKPPIGNLRFKAPEPPEPWDGIRDASEHGPICPQYNERMRRIEPGDEDCLYLNVYTRSLAPAQPRPVMVWIHGGAFYTGSGNSDFYGPEFIIAHDIVLVTINYRLEVLGFLCLDTEEVPGNAGLKDQVAALKWVKNNISSFGGDPDNITIFGCSAGAASVSHHLTSKMSEGLFNKAICQSGVCLNDWSYCLKARERAFQLGKLLGKDTKDPEELLNFLRSVPSSSLVYVQLPSLDVSFPDLTDFIFFGPVIEKSHLNIEKFLSTTPSVAVKKGIIANVPLIVGYTTGEGIEIARKLSSLARFMSESGAVVPRELKYRFLPEKLKDTDKMIRTQYFSYNEISMDRVQQFSDFETDEFFSYNVHRYARYHALYCSSPVYLYKFAAETERNIHKKMYEMEALKGVCHADDLPYLFNITNLEVPLTDESRNIIKDVVRLWTNFASTGIPDEEWKPFKETERNCLIIDKTHKSVRNQDDKNVKFWEEIYGETNLVRLE